MSKTKDAESYAFNGWKTKIFKFRLDWPISVFPLRLQWLFHRLILQHWRKFPLIAVERIELFVPLIGAHIVD